MSGSTLFARLGLAPVMGVILLILGIGVDLGFTQRQSQDVRRLINEREQLRKRLSTLESRDLDSQRLAVHFEVEHLTDLLDHGWRDDPVSYIGAVLTESGLTRLELGTMATAEVGKLQKTQFFLRASGRYERVWRFVKQMEQGPRLATVDALKMEQMIESSYVEARFNLSIYDPLVVQ